MTWRLGKKETEHKRVVSLGSCEMEQVFADTQWSIWNNKTSEVVLNWTELFFSESLHWAVKTMWARRTLTSTCVVRKLNFLQTFEITGNYNYMPERTGSWPAQQQHHLLWQQENSWWWSPWSSPGSGGRSRGTLPTSLCWHSQQPLWCWQVLQAARRWPWLSTPAWGSCHSWSLLVHRHVELSKYVVKPYGDHWLTYATWSTWGIALGVRTYTVTFTQITFLHPNSCLLQSTPLHCYCCEGVVKPKQYGICAHSMCIRPSYLSALPGVWHWLPHVLQLRLCSWQRTSLLLACCLKLWWDLYAEVPHPGEQQPFRELQLCSSTLQSQPQALVCQASTWSSNLCVQNNIFTVHCLPFYASSRSEDVFFHFFCFLFSFLE